MFDSYLQLEGDIEVGEKVTCWGGFGELKEMNDNATKIKLKPWGMR